MATKIWNDIQSHIKDLMTNAFSPNKLKMFPFVFYLNLYETY